MKRLLICLGLMAAVLPAVAEVEWTTDVPGAIAKARAENKTVLLDFTGSDWCSWCKRLKSEVFDQPEFAQFAQANLVMVEVDFPQNKPQDAALKQRNEQLAQNFHIKGFPTVVLLNGDGKQIGGGGYVEGGAKKFISILEEVPGLKHDGAGQQADTVHHGPAPFVPIAPTTPTRYTVLALKGISGAPEQRMALINNQTFMVGETAKVKVQDAKVEVFCKEIREDSVLVTVDGKPQELKLGKH
ncbi:MAG: trxA [Pedosphaera sp.]|nr:trxA [Pedosphaera sp.]